MPNSAKVLAQARHHVSGSSHLEASAAPRPVADAGLRPRSDVSPVAVDGLGVDDAASGIEHGQTQRRVEGIVGAASAARLQIRGAVHGERGGAVLHRQPQKVPNERLQGLRLVPAAQFRTDTVTESPCMPRYSPNRLQQFGR